MELEVQSQKAYLKQPQIFLGNKRTLIEKSEKKDEKLEDKEKRQLRYWKNVGLGFETPRSAIDGQYIDKKCPFTGNVSVRGRILQGIVKSNKMQRSVTVRRDYLNFVPKYKRYQKKHKMITAHISPALRAEEGDTVVIGQTRSLSKTKSYVVLKVVPKSGERKEFTLF